MPNQVSAWGRWSRRTRLRLLAVCLRGASFLPFLSHKKRPLPKEDTPPRQFTWEGSAYCCGAVMITINTWLLFLVIWQCTMAEELSCHQDLQSISLPFSCPFESKRWCTGKKRWGAWASSYWQAKIPPSGSFDLKDPSGLLLGQSPQM